MQTTMPLILGLLGTVLLSAEVVAQPAAAITAQTEYARLGIGADGKGIELVELRTGTNYCRQSAAGPLASVEIEGKSCGATKAAAKGDLVALQFGESGVNAELRITARARYFVIEVVSVSTVTEESSARLFKTTLSPFAEGICPAIIILFLL